MRKPLKLKPSKVFKYNIGERLAAIPEAKRVLIRECICIRGNISNSTLSRYVNCKWDEQQDIPGIVLKEISDILLCPVEDLYNPRPKN